MFWYLLLWNLSSGEISDSLEFLASAWKFSAVKPFYWLISDSHDLFANVWIFITVKPFYQWDFRYLEIYCFETILVVRYQISLKMSESLLLWNHSSGEVSDSIDLKLWTVWTSTSTGIGIVKGQSLNFQITIKNTCSTLTFYNSCASWGTSSYSTSF